jgi:hypothetical protein
MTLTLADSWIFVLVLAIGIFIGRRLERWQRQRKLDKTARAIIDAGLVIKKFSEVLPPGKDRHGGSA